MRSVTLTMDGHVKAEVPTVYLDGRGASPKGGRFKELKTRLKQFMAESPIIDKPGGLGGILSAMAPSVRPRVLLLHGADASTLEWRYLVPRLNELGVDAVAVDWWSGGFTSRAAILGELDQRRSEAPRPWTLVTEHLHAFWKRQLDSRPVIVVGASLGGAVALDFAATFPEAVSGLVLVDGGGESYKSPPPAVVSALAPVALGVKRLLAIATANTNSDELRINSLHRTEPQWADALGAYLSSGGYARRVGQSLIRTVQQPTFVLWGADDDILPVSDAYAFQEDLPDCVGVREVPGCGHTPQLEDPDTVALHIAQFALELTRRQ